MIAIEPCNTVTIRLSPRECQTVELLVGGLTRREVAIRMCISIRTVDYYLDRVRIKTGKPTMIAAIAFVIANDMVLMNSA